MKKYKKPTKDTPQGALVYTAFPNGELRNKDKPLKFICISELDTAYPYIVYDYDEDDDLDYVDSYSNVFLDEEEEITIIEKMEFLLDRIKDGQEFEVIFKDAEDKLSYVFIDGLLHRKQSHFDANYSEIGLNWLLEQDFQLLE
jgi:hypothetical protein